MPLSKIKKEHENTFISFNKGGRVPLGQRKDIDVLAIIAHESQDRYILSVFEKLPSLAELKKAKVDDELKKSGVVTDAAKQPSK